MTRTPNLSRDPAASVIVHAQGSPIADVIRAARRVAASEANVLITGETGTGKEVFARFLHESSARKGRPIVAVNCGAIPEALLESELFGHVRGAFTGAVQSRRGRIAAAEGGTLFLDEIGELPLALQVKLLRVLQDRVYEPVGSTESVAADFRLVAATNRDLAAEVEAGRFRQDLYFRLVVCPIEVPPLRERGDDVACLFDAFWAQRGETRAVEAAVYDALRAHRWPGNVRELENLVERLSVCAEGRSIRVTDLPPALRRLASPPASSPEVRPAVAAVPAAEPGAAGSDAEAASCAAIAAPPVHPIADGGGVPVPDPRVLGTSAIDLARILRGLEDAYIDAALARTGGNKKAAADLLGLQRTTLVEKLRRRQRDARAAEGGFHDAERLTGSHV